ncbi:hypothetical protein Nepgr_006816 [Nepenthes gracilis]|uniref:Uncharacterized protein n=1 Tax=Nepenthes gracilis TaxID=150966 RepID=A0AAD3S5Y7_NEPGR|nr:hypothetical protein Nepgr_006816 [Nepenthes gracilis]
MPPPPPSKAPASEGGSQEQRSEIQSRHKLDNIKTSVRKQHQQSATLDRMQLPFTVTTTINSSSSKINIHIGVPAARQSASMPPKHLRSAKPNMEAAKAAKRNQPTRPAISINKPERKEVEEILAERVVKKSTAAGVPRQVEGPGRRVWEDLYSVSYAKVYPSKRVREGSKEQDHINIGLWSNLDGGVLCVAIFCVGSTVSSGWAPVILARPNICSVQFCKPRCGFYSIVCIEELFADLVQHYRDVLDAALELGMRLR